MSGKSAARLLGLAMLAAVAGPAAADPATPPAANVVAEVNGTTIGVGDFELAVRRAARSRFYHGKVEGEALKELRRDVLDDLITEHLLVAEARRRGVEPAVEDVEAKLASYEARYKDSAQWLENRDVILPQLRARMLQNSLLHRLEGEVRDVPDPSEAELRAFYDANLEAFTEPVQNRVAVILLTVDPSSPQEVWAAALEEAERIHAQLTEGANFAELARLHSADESAENGGDMGYLHAGMLAPAAEKAIDALEEGALSEPVGLLRGIALFKLLDRKEAVRHPLDEVRDRAIALYKRDMAAARWAELKEALRAEADIQTYLAVAEAANDGAGGPVDTP